MVALLAKVAASSEMSGFKGSCVTVVGIVVVPAGIVVGIVVGYVVKDAG